MMTTRSPEIALITNGFFTDGKYIFLETIIIYTTVVPSATSVVYAAATNPKNGIKMKFNTILRTALIVVA